MYLVIYHKFVEQIKRFGIFVGVTGFLWNGSRDNSRRSNRFGDE